MHSFHSIALMLGMNGAQFQSFIYLISLAVVAIGFAMKIEYDDRKREKKNKDKSQ